MAFQRKNPKREPMPWRKDILSHHSHKDTRADRAEFPRQVIEQLMIRAGGKCEACKQRPDSETHHIYPRGRGGRGVLQNGLRLCHQCHMEIQCDEEKLQYWVSEWERRYGDHFWFDQQDWDDYNRKQAAEREKEAEKEQRLTAIEPIVDLLTVAAGRKLNTKELRLIEAMTERQAATFAKLMHDCMASQVKPEIPFGYNGMFDD